MMCFVNGEPGSYLGREVSTEIEQRFGVHRTTKALQVRFDSAPCASSVQETRA